MKVFKARKPDKNGDPTFGIELSAIELSYIAIAAMHYCATKADGDLRHDSSKALAFTMEGTDRADTLRITSGVGFVAAALTNVLSEAEKDADFLSLRPRRDWRRE